MELFARLYLDEDVDVLLAKLINARGFDAVTTLSAANVGRSDLEQLEFAATAERVLITHNRVDFESLAAEWLVAGNHHAGIIISVRRTTYEIARRLLLLLNQVAADEFVDQVRYI